MTWFARAGWSLFSMILFAAPILAASGAIYWNWGFGAKTAWVLVLVYAFWEWFPHRKDSMELELASEQVYFLGYLCTITAFLVLVLRLGAIPANSRLTQVLLMGGVALSTTVSGLLGMAVLRAMARGVRRSVERLSSPEQTVVRVELAGELAQNLEHLRKEAEETAKSVSQVRREFETMVGASAALGGSLKAGTESTSSFANRLGTAQQVFDAYIASVEDKSDVEQRIGESLERVLSIGSATERTAVNLTKQLDQLQQRVALFEEGIGAGDHCMLEFVTAIKDVNAAVDELKQVLDGFVTLQELSLEERPRTPETRDEDR